MSKYTESTHNLINLTSGSQLIVGAIYDRYGPMTQHLKLWLRMLDKPIEYSIVQIGEHERMNMMVFHDQTHYDEYQKWWKDYCILFGGEANAMLDRYPTVKTGDSVEGTIVDMKPRVGDMEAQWQFIVANCGSKVLYIGKYWLFKDPSDACIFELKFVDGYDTEAANSIYDDIPF